MNNPANAHCTDDVYMSERRKDFADWTRENLVEMILDVELAERRMGMSVEEAADIVKTGEVGSVTTDSGGSTLTIYFPGMTAGEAYAFDRSSITII